MGVGDGGGDHDCSTYGAHQYVLGRVDAVCADDAQVRVDAEGQSRHRPARKPSAKCRAPPPGAWEHHVAAVAAAAAVVADVVAAITTTPFSPPAPPPGLGARGRGWEPAMTLRVWAVAETVAVAVASGPRVHCMWPWTRLTKLPRRQPPPQPQPLPSPTRPHPPPRCPKCTALRRGPKGVPMLADDATLVNASTEAATARGRGANASSSVVQQPLCSPMPRLLTSSGREEESLNVGVTSPAWPRTHSRQERKPTEA